MTEVEMLDITSTIFDGMGYDFGKLKNILYHTSIKDITEEYNGSVRIVETDDGVDVLAPTEESILAYHNEIKAQIKDIESKRDISFNDFKKDLIRADMREYEVDYEDKFAKYAEILFLVLAAAGKESYHPRVDYQYKCPTKKQRRLIQLMLDIWPYNWFRHTHNVWEFVPKGDRTPKPFSFVVGGYEVKVEDYEHQKQIFEILKKEYIRQGLNQRYPYGEEKAPDLNDSFSVTRKNLEKQMNYDGRSNKTKQHWKRDLAYRIHFLKHTEEWFNDEPIRIKQCATKIKEISFIPLPVLSICDYPFPSSEANLIGKMFFRFGIYDKKNGYNGNKQRILSLIGDIPKTYFLDYLLESRKYWKQVSEFDDEDEE